MVQTVGKQLSQNELIERIAALSLFFEQNGDNVSASRARDLVYKLRDSQYAIAFCGHFSAGKSSMINKIVGENLLPSSPIPTSANLVKVKSGEDYAKVYLKEGMPKLYPAPYDYEKIKKYSKDGDLIHTVEISHSETNLPKDTVIMDTPGIDSTDDAHRIATESALHLADMVFYVMDYNHVQSELNFLFTKDLTAAGKQVYLIINQIDKHREEELSFQHFTESVKDSFASWGVQPERIFYTSLKKPELPHNDFSALQKFIYEQIGQKDRLLPQSVLHSLQKLTEDHFIYLEEKDAHDIAANEEILAALPEDERALVFEKIEQLQSHKQALQQKKYQAEIDLNHDMEDLLNNAYLMPFQTRELAENYLESMQPGFKVGLLFAKAKTEQERSTRLSLLYNDLKEKVQSQIEWHVKELFLKKLKDDHIHHNELQSQAQNININIPESLLKTAIKEGARLSGDYVLQYTRDVSDAVKKETKKQIINWKELYLKELEELANEKILAMKDEWDAYARFGEALNILQEIKAKQSEQKAEIKKLLAGELDHKKVSASVQELMRPKDEDVQIIREGEEEFVDNKQVVTTHSIVEKEMNQENNHEADIEAQISKLEHTAKELRDIPGFHKISAELLEKADRLQSRSFTVALFGAFSAGKSSFANALIGEKILPVSPNPTTAAINKIMPVTAEYPHGTVKVFVKSEKVMFADINRSLQVFNQQAQSFSEAIGKIDVILKEHHDFDAHEKTHFAFLAAFGKGYNNFQEKLGKEVITDLTELADYVAKEEKSCFVEMIEVYYQCDLTDRGITLVDTPGADSINARHTGVAFDYIKNSDAILFVTYYNHAFSKADREFLIQLGRVKDAFELDKMFFIVNAIDLASDEEEKNDVLQYVHDQLIQYGIRRPTLHGLSSLQALFEKQSGEEHSSGMKDFEESFYRFINHDLMSLSLSAAELEWNRVMNQLRTFIESSKESKEAKLAKRELLTNELAIIKEKIAKDDLDLLTQALNQEADELVFYIKQRVFLRFNDFLKESFNPGQLKEDGRDMKKALQVALEDFLQSFGYDFAQELRATTIRLEVFIGKLLQQTYEKRSNQVNQLNRDVTFSRPENPSFEGVNFESAFSNVDRTTFKKAMSYFKNPKNFFEKNERKLLAESLEESLQEPTDVYLHESSKQLKDYYDEKLSAVYQQLLSDLIAESEEYYKGLLATLSQDFPIEQLVATEERLRAY
ncbi:dynamin family protein [Cytobacillus kochii]|uniref:dynamin family protein n=1 Tax=Cytobacillus kochii TaxID=859143 RepID=UPI001CD46A47|nr:dynamin family protein [Cytobacillus kochii]MCA1027186.1 dynamin family protein [Cytobacillus kochii]